MTDSKKLNTGPHRHLEHKARGVTVGNSVLTELSSPPSTPTPESPPRRLRHWAWSRSRSPSARPRARCSNGDSHNGRRAAAFDQPAYPRGVATSRPSSPAPARRPLWSPQHALFAPLCALGLGLFILLYMYMCQGIRSPSPVIQQHFEGPINAPVINYISADQQADVKAQVSR